MRPARAGRRSVNARKTDGRTVSNAEPAHRLRGHHWFRPCTTVGKRRAHRVAFPLITCCSGSGILDVGICGQGATDQWGLQL
eukprot:5876970-Prymnesium_polylepis.1